MLPRHPAGTLALDQRPCRPGGQTAPQRDARPWATVNPRASQPRPTPHHRFPPGPMPAGDHAAHRPRGHINRWTQARGGPPPRPLQVQRGADSAATAPRTPQAGRPDTWIQRTPGHRTRGRWTSARPVGRTDTPTAGPGTRTGQRPAGRRPDILATGDHPLGARPRPGHGAWEPSATQDGSAVMAPAPRPDRRRHWTAAQHRPGM